MHLHYSTRTVHFGARSCHYGTPSVTCDTSSHQNGTTTCNSVSLGLNSDHYHIRYHKPPTRPSPWNHSLRATDH